MNIRAAAFIVFSIAASFAIARPATEPPQLRDEPNIPSGGYRRTVERLYRTRRAAERNATLSGPDPAATRVMSGTRSVPVLLLTFADEVTGLPQPDGPFARTDYQQLLFSDPAVLPVRRTLTQYYWDVSGMRLRVNGSVTDWFAMTKPVAEYLRVDDTNNDGVGDRYTGQAELLETVFRRADAQLDFAQFDNDGPDGRPNSGDDDGKVDTVFLIHSQSGAECVNDPAAGIWSHSWRYSTPALGKGRPFETRAVRLGKNKKPLLVGGVAQHIVIDDYTIQPGLACDDGNGPRLIEIGVFCHEYGHALGIPDLYDRTPRNTPDSRGVGNHCIMSSGSWGVDNGHPQDPVGLSAWPRYYLGWAPVTEISAAGTVNVDPAEKLGVAYRYTVPGTNGEEYFLAEYRDAAWKDPTNQHINWDAPLGTSGIAIWHVDERVGMSSATWPFTEYGKGQNDDASVPDNAGKFRTARALVALIQADGKMDLESNGAGFEPADLWRSGSRFGDDPHLRAGSRAYDGKPTGWGFGSIDLAAGTVVTELQSPPVPLVAAAESPVQRTGPAVAAIQPKAVVDTLTSNPSLSNTFDKTNERLDGLDQSSFTRDSRLPVESRPLVVDDARFNVAVEAIERKSATVPKIDRTVDGQLAERLTGMTLPSALSKIDDARSRWKELRAIVGDVDLVLGKGSKSGTGESVVFEQTVKVGGETLPVFDSEVTFHYTLNALNAVTSTIVPPQELVVTGANDALKLADVKKLAAELLGVATSRLGSIREGIFRSDPTASAARVAFLVELEVGPGAEPIHVFIDEATGQLLEMR